jgi:hypothetical protein
MTELVMVYDTSGFRLAADTVAPIARLGLPFGCRLFPAM